MALRQTRLITKLYPSRGSVLTPITCAKRFATDSAGGGSSGGAPYRPYPAAKYWHPHTADYWSSQGFRPQSEKDDEYPEEKVYLEEIEERLRTYDKKYRDSDEYKNLYNEFGWTPVDDRATYNYGGTLGGEQYGAGKKIDPSHYITPEWCNVNRKPIPPIQYMTADQIRRSRGSLASVRELPPETESIWKYWNGYSAGGVFTAIVITKEFYVTGGHDFMEAITLWGWFGCAAALAADWYAWWHTLLVQEAYDRDYFPLLQKVQKLDAKLEAINSKPNEKRLMSQIQKYREMIAEKVLSKTLGNRLGRIVESTVAKLDAKVNEEATARKDAETQWKRSALQQSVEYFDDENVRREFMKEALAQFCSGDTAKLSNSAVTVAFQTDAFKEQYQSNYNNAKQNYLSEQRAKGSLSPVFMDESERAALSKSAPEKAEAYEEKIRQWASGRNAVNAQIPSFA
eukprot:CAMPEP_0202726802 /NCGR_PEP_ID=MMETSP1385-20130828/184798_1 /ASSEMBLY_ACC=CAM_ASM_000861 /TAXON_ID=933848 /ORGANISM="Elphidium margaritaceum" /LENGTH=455 /DNA_ID=CAMNT_0049393031 /DNA_START=20 /DNA_END=1387 /DNA_ORIENTATION=-